MRPYVNYSVLFRSTLLGELRRTLWPDVAGGALPEDDLTSLLAACSAAALAVMNIRTQTLNSEVEALLNEGSS